PVAVMTAVQRKLRSIDRQLERRAAARAKRQRWTSAGVLRTIQYDQQIGAEPIAIPGDRQSQAGRAGLFFSVDDDLNIAGGKAAGRIPCGARGHDRGFVLDGGAGVNAPLIFEARERSEIADLARTVFHATVPQDRLKRAGLLPFRGIDRLAVVMDVIEDGPRRVGNAPLAENERIALR